MQMDGKAREVVEKRFGVKLDAARSSAKQQAAWDVYQNASVKIVKAITNDARIDDALGYSATIARNTCRDHWRIQNPGWADLKGRLHRFFSKQPKYALWKLDEFTGSICGPSDWQSKPLAEGRRVSELVDDPRRVSSKSLPKSNLVDQLDAAGWDRLLRGVFDYLGGPVRIDEMVSIVGVLFGVKGSREMAIDEFTAWSPHTDPIEEISVREQLARLWTEIKTMPKRWILPFLLNPPDRSEIAVLASRAEIESLIAFTADQYAILWSAFGLAGADFQFSVVWERLPLEDETIAAVMGLESGQKVINLRAVAKNHLARALTTNMKRSVAPSPGEGS
jgi:hypothetical protein